MARSWRPRFSPRGDWTQVPPRSVQDKLREVFGRWGLPGGFRVDNGVPWGSPGDLPTDLALWLIGLGVGVSWDAPRRPQQNGVVEKSQDTAKRWAEPRACAGVEELQGRLEEMDGIQRQEYPSIGGRSRLEAYPGLAHSGRRYSRAWEWTNWDLGAVAEALAGYAPRRRVSKAGTISIYNGNYHI